jgi:hypothetical protein
MVYKNALRCHQNVWFANCVWPNDGSLIRAETCCLHGCKFVLINSCVGRLFGLNFYSMLNVPLTLSMSIPLRSVNVFS